MQSSQPEATRQNTVSVALVGVFGRLAPRDALGDSSFEAASRALRPLFRLRAVPTVWRLVAAG